MLENIKCNICGSNDYEEKFYSVPSGFLVRCKKCDLYYVNPRNTKFLITKAKERILRPEIDESKLIQEKNRRKEFKKYLKKINQFSHKKGRILDIGCNIGIFLDEARKDGWEVYGVEPAYGAYKYATEILKLNVLNCTLEEATFKDNFFDVVTLFAVLEHVSNPRELLKEIRRIIKLNGLLVIHVPYANKFYINVVRKKWRQFIGGHFYWFTKSSLHKLLEICRFQPIKFYWCIRTVDLNIISYRLSDPYCPLYFEKIGKLFRNFILKLKLKNFSIPLCLFDEIIVYAKAY